MTRRTTKNILIATFLMVAGFLPLSKAMAQTNTVFQDDFEGNSIFAGWDNQESCCSYSLANSTNFRRTGKKSLRVELRKSDADVGGSKRAELTDNSYPIPPETNRRWWAFSNYLPSDFGRDSVHESLAQWHDRPKSSSVSLNPPLSLQIYKGNWIIELKYDSIDVNLDKGANVKSKTFVLGPWQKGVWNDWVFNYNYSYNNDGYLKVWKNGVLMLDYKGKNFYNGSYDPFFKLGLYRWVWSTSWPKSYEQSVYSTRYYYVDNLKVGNKNSILQDFLIPSTVPTNVNPIAYAGYKQTIALPVNTATIKGSSSTDPDGSIASYQWYIESGPNTPTMASTTTADLKISGMIQGTYTYRLTVTDNLGAKSSAISYIVITGSGTANQIPILSMGATKILTLPTNSIQLSASGTYDPDGSISSYQWTQESGPSTALITNANSVTPTVSSLVNGSYYFKLKVTDNKGGYNTDYVQVFVDGTSTSTPTAPTTNQQPVANAGNNQKFPAIYSTIGLNGSSSYDPDGSITKYKWNQISGPSATLTTPDASTTVAIVNTVAGIYVFRLIVTDNGGLMDTATVTVNVTPATAAGGTSTTTNQQPVANAGNNQKFPAIYSTIGLNGNSSYDPDGTITKYKWSQVSGPSTTLTTPDSSTTVSKTISAMVAGTYVFRLIVTDNGGLMDTATITVTLTPATAIASARTRGIAADQPPVEVAYYAPINNWKWPGKSMVVYPNPMQNQFTVDINTQYQGTTILNVYNLQGSLIHQERFQKTSVMVSRQVSLNNLSRGTYLVEISSGGKQVGVQRIIKAE